MTSQYARFSASVCQVLLLVLIAFGTPACSKDPAKAKKEYFESGVKYFNENKFREAVIQFKNAIAIDGRYAEAHYQLGICYSKLGQIPLAYREFVKTTDLDAGHVGAQLRQGALLLAQRKFDEAKAKAELILKSDPRNVDAQVLLGNSYAGLKDLDRAIEELQEAVDLDPKQVPHYLNLAAAQYFNKQPDLAEATFKKAISQDSKNVQPRIALAQLCSSTERSADGEATLKAAIEANPESIEAHQALAYFYHAKRVFKNPLNAAPGGGASGESWRS
ncbi:MAG: tetratricopeptide repeat protein [Acidimicrobiia bacterium]|nr:tetratricopeptide repeat protein [Acidimicrobiia bacterium]